jgi:hypothetical protein
MRQTIGAREGKDQIAFIEYGLGNPSIGRSA